MGKEVTQRQLKANEQASQRVLGQCHALVDWRTGAGHREPEAVRVCGLRGWHGWGKLRQRPKGTASVCQWDDPLALNATTAAGDVNKDHPGLFAQRVAASEGGSCPDEASKRR